MRIKIMQRLNVWMKMRYKQMKDKNEDKDKK